MLDQFDRMPPFLVRALSRDSRHERELTVKEISERTGLSESTIDRLSRMITWAHVDIGVADRFTTACDVDLLNLNGHYRWRKRRWRGREAELTPLVEQWLNHLNGKNPG